MFKSIKTGVNIIKSLMRLSLLNILQYKAQFVAAFFSATLEIVIYIIFIQSIFGQVPSISGWSNKEVILLMGIATINISLIRSFITPNLKYLSTVVRQGELDFILLKPYDSQFLISFNKTNFFALTQLIQGIIIVICSGKTCSTKSVLLCIWVMLMSCFIIYSFWFTILLIVFKTVKIDNAIAGIDILLNFVRYPMSVYPNLIRMFFTYIIPLAFVAFVPSLVYLQRSSTFYIVIGTFLALLFFTISRVMWKVVIKRYSSASS